MKGKKGGKDSKKRQRSEVGPQKHSSYRGIVYPYILSAEPAKRDMRHKLKQQNLESACQGGKIGCEKETGDSDGGKLKLAWDWC